MKIFFLSLSICIIGHPVLATASKYPIVTPEEKEITATTTYFDPQEEERVILMRN